jgi:hypothetical protein
LNLAAVGIDHAAWERVRCALARVSATRFAEEGASFRPEWLARDRLVQIASALACGAGSSARDRG